MSRTWIDVHLTGWDILIWTAAWTAGVSVRAAVSELHLLRRIKRTGLPVTAADRPGVPQQAPDPENGREVP